MKDRPPLGNLCAVGPLALLLGGCVAGSPPADSPADRENDLVAKRAAQVESLKREAGDDLSDAAKELEAELFLTDSGKVVARAIRAHGGWDAWTALSSVTYVRDRIAIDEKGQPVTGSQKQNQLLSFKVDPDGHLISGQAANDSEGDLLLALPFVLVHMEGRKDYLGVEADAKNNELYEKIRCERGSARGGGRFTAYFDYSSFVLRRVLVEQDGKFRLIVFSSWVEVGGVKIATKRSVYHLKSLFEHKDMGRPDELEVLENVRSGVGAP